MSKEHPGQSGGGVVSEGHGIASPPGQGGGMPPGQEGGTSGHAAPGLAQAPNSNRTLLMVGLGCGGLLLFGLVAVAGAVLWFKVRADATVDELQRLQSNTSTKPGLDLPPSGTAKTKGAVPGELKGDCGIAYACCRAIAAKTDANDAALDACELFKTAAYPESTCTAALLGYRKAADALGVPCE